MHFTQIKETCLYFQDLEKAKEFYHGLLGLPVISHVEDKHIFFRAGSSVLLCFNPDDSKQKKSPPPHFVEGNYHFALEVERNDYQKYKEEIAQKKIPIIDIVIWKNGQKSFYFNDPVGNVVEIVPKGIWE
ncbi:MAG: VOC family protein [Cyclobacteriaceae bacterium]